MLQTNFLYASRKFTLIQLRINPDSATEDPMNEFNSKSGKLRSKYGYTHESGKARFSNSSLARSFLTFIAGSLSLPARQQAHPFVAFKWFPCASRSRIRKEGRKCRRRKESWGADRRAPTVWILRPPPPPKSIQMKKRMGWTSMIFTSSKQWVSFYVSIGKCSLI